eukprot:CAMPEP_0115848176 /NCGR_PEP_ID=MMETSP0287-20121206/10780_1 /TAXON_ID=412157 /ORGANISM="Chrysochromulina rotalis, Strain UIO044" /LENGTH=103 /DNA_ID=CAMNT_0003302067 /DNA_START=210 /DNA_END=518 /DNA_ORIENTATION=+
MPPVAPVAPPFSCDFLTLPSAIADDEASTIELEFNDLSKAGSCFKRALACPISTGPAATAKENGGRAALANTPPPQASASVDAWAAGATSRARPKHPLVRICT